MGERKRLRQEEIINKVMEKKEFSRLPRRDVELVYASFNEQDHVVEEKIRLTRDKLRKMYTAFVSCKLLNLKEKDRDWFLFKHLSTKERIGHFADVYTKSLEGMRFMVNVYDLGSGINGFSYEDFPKKITYRGFEAVGQLVDLQNNYFSKEKFNATCTWGSLFDLEEVKNFLSKGMGNKVVFLFKTLDSLEMLYKDYSKDLLDVVVPLVDRVVVSFATKSLGKGKKFFAKRKWLVDYIKKNYEIIHQFDCGVEHYIIFKGK